MNAIWVRLPICVLDTRERSSWNDLGSVAMADLLLSGRSNVPPFSFVVVEGPRSAREVRAGVAALEQKYHLIAMPSAAEDLELLVRHAGPVGPT